MLVVLLGGVVNGMGVVWIEDCKVGLSEGEGVTGGLGEGLFEEVGNSTFLLPVLKILLVSLERGGGGGGGTDEYFGDGVTTPVGFEGVSGEVRTLSLSDRLTGTPVALTINNNNNNNN